MMTYKKKKKKKVYKSPFVPFVGQIPIYQDGTQIPQPIIQEESAKIQQVSITNSIPPLDNTIKQVDFTSTAQISSLGITQRRTNIIGIIGKGTWTVTSTVGYDSTGTTEINETTANAAYLKSLAFSWIITAGTLNYGAFYITITNPSAVITAYYEKVSTNTTQGGEILLTFNDMLLEAGTNIKVQFRKDCTGLTCSGIFSAVLEEI